MNKLFISLMAALMSVLFVGVHAQGITSPPQTSTAANPIWYDLGHPFTGGFISVDGSGVAQVEEQDSANKSQMFRFEKDGDSYAIINHNGKYLSTTLNGSNQVVLSTTKSLWTLSYSSGYQAFSIGTTAGGLQPVSQESTLTLKGAIGDDQSYWYINLRTEPLEGPIVSDGTTEVWYYLLNQRGYPNPTKYAITDMGEANAASDNPLKGSVVSATNAGQLWKFTREGDQYILISKKGNYMNGFSTNSASGTPVELLNPNGSPGAWQISVGGQVMHVDNNLNVSAWSNGPESYHVIISEGDFWGVELKAKITAAETLLASAKVGTGVGEFTQAAIDAFAAAVNQAKAVADNPASTGQQVTQAAATLTQAQTTFNATVGMPKVSTETETYWYYLRSTFDKYSVLKQPYATSRTADDRIALTVTPTGDSYLWKLKAGSNGKYILENKTKAGSIQTAKPPVIGSGTTNEWTITYRGNGQFTLTAADGVEFHADQAGLVVQWNANPIENSASCWTFIAPIVDKTVLQTSINNATTLKNNAVVGSKGGQYSQESITALEAAIAAAQTAYDDSDLTLDQYFVASSAITSAVATFKAAVNPAHDIAVESIAGQLYNLKYIGIGVNNGKYLTNPRTESDNDVMAQGGRPQVRFKDVTDATTAFKFVASTASPAHITIHNDRGVSGLNGGGDYIDENGRMRPASIFDDTQWSWFILKAEDATLAEGTKVGLYSNFSNKYVVARADTAITTMSPDASPALYFQLEAFDPASIQESGQTTIKAVAHNGRIVVYGIENKNYEIYSIEGVRMNKESRLAAGVYFVRIEDKTSKVVVK